MSQQLFMLDTTICSFAMRLQPHVIGRIENMATSARLAISAIVYSELVDGVLGPKAMTPTSRSAEPATGRPSRR